MRGLQGMASHGMDRRSRVGTRRASIRKNVSTGIDVVPSMLTALRRPSITFSASNDPDRTSGTKSSSSEGNREKSSCDRRLPALAGRRRATSSMTGQSAACAGLSALALPRQDAAPAWRRASSGRLLGMPRCRLRSRGCHHRGELRMLALGESVVGVALEPEEPAQLRIADALEEEHLPAERRAPRCASAARACPASCWQ